MAQWVSLLCCDMAIFIRTGRFMSRLISAMSKTITWRMFLFRASRR